MCECLDYDDGTRHTCEACVGDLEMLRDALARSEAARREAEEKLERLRLEVVAAFTSAGEFMLVGFDPTASGEVSARVKRMADALASERAACESWEREFNVANTERLRLHDEVENLAERISQFEAAGFPNVSVVLDRVGAERAAREALEKELAVLRSRCDG